MPTIDRRWTAAALLVLTTTMLARDADALPKPPLPDPDPWLPGFDPTTPPPPPPPPPSPPDADDPPATPGTPIITARDATAIMFRWQDHSDFELGTAIERSNGDDSFTDIVSFGPLSGETTLTAVGLTPDTPSCFRVRTWNTHGTRWSGTTCAFTTDGTDRTVVEAEVVLVTADIEDAGTDDGVLIQLNTHEARYTPSNNGTWIDYGGDDFERGQNRTYHVSLSEVNGAPAIDQVSDVELFRITKEGNDWWCLEEVQLQLGGVTFFQRRFDAEPDGCLWIGGGKNDWTSIEFDHATLRAEPAWQVNSPLLLPVFPADSLVSRVESMIGNAIHEDNPLYWGHLYGKDWVESRKFDEHTLHFDADLAADVTGSDPEVDIDFDLVVTGGCEADGTLTFEVVSDNVVVDANSSILGSLPQFFGCLYPTCADEIIEERVLEAFPHTGLSASVPDVQLCIDNPTLQWHVTDNGDFSLL